MDITVPDFNDIVKAMKHADLGGYAFDAKQYLGAVDNAIAQLKQHRADIQALVRHAHTWTADDYCSICGSDGRA